MKGKGPHYPQYSYDIIRKHSLMISSDIKEYNKVGDTKTPSLHSIPFNFKVKNGDIMSTGQYMNHKSFTIIQFQKLLRKSSHSIKTELRDSTAEKLFLCPWELHELFSCLARFRIIIFALYFIRKNCSKFS